MGWVCYGYRLEEVVKRPPGSDAIIHYNRPGMPYRTIGMLRKEFPLITCPSRFHMSPILVVVAYPTLAPRERPMTYSLGCHVTGACLPTPDVDHVPSNVAGALARILRRVPSASTAKLRHARSFVRIWLKTHVQPLARDTEISFEQFREHLRSQGYNLERIQEYEEAWGRVQRGEKFDPRACKGHTKPEDYPEFKFARMICSRSDTMKVLFGMYTMLIDRVMYELPYFIKHVPVCQRAAFIASHAKDGYSVLETDHTAFEAHMTPDVMQVFELELYRHVLKNVSGGKMIVELMKKTFAGENVVTFKGFSCSVAGRRMSGDMVTSLGNGFTNLMVLLYLMEQHGHRPDTYFVVVEGDDGLCQVYVRSDKDLPQGPEFDSLGFEVKMERRENLASSSFCTMVFDPEDKQNIIDPAEAVVKFGWSRSKEASCPRNLPGLLRAKALSLMCEAPGCPFLRNLAEYGLRVTQGACPKFDKHEHWWNQQLQIDKHLGECLRTSVGINSRHVMAATFGVSVEQQLSLETYLDSLSSLQPLSHPVLDAIMKPQWKENWDRHVRQHS